MLVALLASACGASARSEAKGDSGIEPRAIRAATAVVIERPVTRFVTVTGTLTADEQADVSAEIAGRVVSTPVERGSAVREGAELIRIADTEVRAQAQEAEANASQLAARLALTDGVDLELDRVPEVANAKASSELAASEFERARMLHDKQLLSQADYDRSRAQADAARRQYDIARNNAEQLYQSLLAARARLTVARKALADTVVKAPFAGVVELRLVSTGDYVTRGTKVASVMRINPMRVELTVPQQLLASVAPGRAVALQVDAYPGRSFTGRVRYVSPALKTDSRALVVEAVVPNEHGELKPGLFATAQLERDTAQPALLVPAGAVRTISGTARVYAVSSDGLVQERIVTTGQTVGDLIEITSGVARGDTVAVSNVTQLADGVRIAR
ncbi:MAG: efflux RND transporter periplasmic adaptor subunit [Acidobacteria bacterium]|nr:efflux RND transporter periplasmic adaptor subunit [Acidobacteriota bacterium]